MKKPLNEYRVRVVKQVAGEAYIKANSLQEAELLADRMDSEQVMWDDEEWPELDVELVRTGKWSLMQVVPAALSCLKAKEQTLLYVALKDAWDEFLSSPQAADMLRAQQEQYGPFAPKEDA